MLITRTSMLTGKVHTLDIPVTIEQLDKWERGELIQRAMPNLSDDDREFIMSGITQDEWEEHMIEPEED